jgi:serine/threonine-protein kinase RsbW
LFAALRRKGLDRQGVGVLNRHSSGVNYWERGFPQKSPETVKEETLQLNLPSRVESVGAAADKAAQLVTEAGLGDDAAFGIDMAVREAVTNAVLHGNREDAAKEVEVKFHYSSAVFEITVRDQGAGFVLADVPDPTEAENLLKTSGRGILFMRTFMDEVEWTRHPAGGTVVRLVKRR